MLTDIIIELLGTKMGECNEIYVKREADDAYESNIATY